MEDLKAKLEKLRNEADDCELIGRLAIDPGKRALFSKLALDLRAMARDVEAVIAGRQTAATDEALCSSKRSGPDVDRRPTRSFGAGTQAT